jgi:hypothetical protein
LEIFLFLTGEIVFLCLHAKGLAANMAALIFLFVRSRGTNVSRISTEKHMTSEGNRQQRRKARSEGELDTSAFIALADRFIDLANRENRKVNATQLHMAFLYAAARYNAFVAKNVFNIENHEDFVGDMTRHYQEMLRNHLADPSL